MATRGITKAEDAAFREARMPCTSFHLDADDMEFCGGQTWIEPTYTVRYSVTKYRDCGRDVCDVEIKGVELESAVAWWGDSGVDLPWNKSIAANAWGWWQLWIERPGNRERVERACLSDYQRNYEG